MGMDVIGRSPSTPQGKYFRANGWWWQQLASYVCHVAPKKLTGKCKSWYSNDGAGLNSADSIKLADILQAEIDAGRTQRYQQIRESEIEGLTGPGEAQYGFDVRLVQEFVTFLRGCGGFKIF